MKKLSLLLLLAMCLYANARDIYVYNGTNAVKAINDVNKITFSNGKMNVEQQ